MALGALGAAFALSRELSSTGVYMSIGNQVVCVFIAGAIAGGLTVGVWERHSCAAAITTEQLHTKTIEVSASSAAFVQATTALITERAQTQTTNRSIQDEATAMSSVERRIAAGGLRPKSSVCSCPMPERAATASGVPPATAQSVPVDAGRDGANVSEPVESAVLENAAKDAVTCEHAIQWACDQGMCK